MSTRRDPMPDEQALEREARALLPALPDLEPRTGFAVRVAAAARDGRHPLLAWLRWSVGGVTLAGVAALAVVVGVPRSSPISRGDEVVLAQRLDLFEDMDVLQHQESLEDLEVVEVLHNLQEPQP